MSFLYVPLFKLNDNRLITQIITQQVKKINSPTFSAGYKQVIDKPTHVANNSVSCVDLLFCTNQNTISNYD